MNSGLVMFALQASLGLVVFGVALNARPSDLVFLGRHPALLARSLVSVNVAMPLLALWVAVVFNLDRAVELALVALAMSPIPPFLPLSAKRAGGDASYTVGLLAVESIVAMVLIPLTVWCFGVLLSNDLHMPPGPVARIVVTGILIPLLAGAVLHQ
ncbi:MAG: hypothetical protein ACREPM_21620, partial [Gemmatimonadaceae bacterium]